MLHGKYVVQKGEIARTSSPVFFTMSVYTLDHIIQIA